MPRKATKALVLRDIRRKKTYLRGKHGRFTSIEKQERRQIMIYLAIIFGMTIAFIICGYLHDHAGELFVKLIKLFAGY